MIDADCTSGREPRSVAANYVFFILGTFLRFLTFNVVLFSARF